MRRPSADIEPAQYRPPPMPPIRVKIVLIQAGIPLVRGQNPRSQSDGSIHDMPGMYLPKLDGFFLWTHLPSPVSTVGALCTTDADTTIPVYHYIATWYVFPRDG